MLERIKKWFKVKWKQLCCDHEWRPVHHSYECPKCGLYDKD